ncbi:MAG: PH domain-containing protein [Pyramidobacter sp.]|jgi:hypothetical protein
MPISKENFKEQLKKVGKFHKWFVGKELRALPKLMDEGEEIGFLTSGYDGRRNTVLVVATNRRLMILDSDIIYGSDDRIFPYSKINSIRGQRGFFFGKLRISTAGVSGDDVVISWIAKSDIARMIPVVSRYCANAKS